MNPIEINHKIYDEYYLPKLDHFRNFAAVAQLFLASGVDKHLQHTREYFDNHSYLLHHEVKHHFNRLEAAVKSLNRICKVIERQQLGKLICHYSPYLWTEYNNENSLLLPAIQSKYMAYILGEYMVWISCNDTLIKNAATNHAELINELYLLQGFAVIGKEGAISVKDKAKQIRGPKNREIFDTSISIAFDECIKSSSRVITCLKALTEEAIQAHNNWWEQSRQSLINITVKICSDDAMNVCSEAFEDAIRHYVDYVFAHHILSIKDNTYNTENFINDLKLAFDDATIADYLKLYKDICKVANKIVSSNVYDIIDEYPTLMKASSLFAQYREIIINKSIRYANEQIDFATVPEQFREYRDKRLKELL